ncbi:MAG TPA: 2-oxo acid dehydrogenase subunit E2 [Baekduia sp.]|uniref:2-oxo acid dehydrogenase subunit E2 n=1 Tax=Baekduia sp. TaxID=2600305 RepID=UPI002D76A97B|nr:2-oxo acid dehydrogenase subunit E2 [Baekduia sp.]HET6510135.1 2-oxo acid dehydrogenase subunit E2 [Baekduia sp.]
MSAETSATAGGATGAKGALDPIEPTAAQRTHARRVAEAKATIPDFQVSIAADLAGVSLGAVAAAAGRALKAHANVNGAYADAKFQHYTRANVGVVLEGAVPVVVDADAKDAEAIAAELDAAAEQVAAGTLPGAAQSGSTFTVARVEGVSAWTAIIQPGHAAALAVGDGALTLSADARIVAPAEAGAFLRAVADAL